MQARASMLLCAKARFLTSSQMAGLCRSENGLMASHFYIRLPGTVKLDWPLTYIESPEECTAHEALFLLRTLARRF